MSVPEQARSVHRAVTVRYALSLLAVAALSLVGWMLMSSELANHRAQDERISLAGAQRMLSHQMAGLLAERMGAADDVQRARADAELAAAERRFLHAFETLTGPLADRRDAAAVATADLRRAYYAGDTAVAATVSHIERGLLAVRENRMTKNGAADFIAWMRGPAISSLDVAVAAHKSAASHSLHDLKGFQALDIAALLLVLMLEATFVFAPLARRLSRQTRELLATSDRLEATLADMARLATTDALTGLSNRRALDLDVERRDGDAAAPNRGRIGVVSFDLDWFKEVNDRHGHAAGDAVLRAVGERVKAVCRQEDFAARMGGDEFIVLLANAPSAEFVAGVAERIRTAVIQPVRYHGLSLTVGVSIGTCLVPDQAADLLVALQVADTALRVAKRAGKSRIVRAAADADTTLVHFPLLQAG